MAPLSLPGQASLCTVQRDKQAPHVPACVLAALPSQAGNMLFVVTLFCVVARTLFTYEDQALSVGVDRDRIPSFERTFQETDSEWAFHLTL